MNIGELRNKLMVELDSLVSGASDAIRAKEVVRLANSTNELLRTELQIKKMEMQLEEAGKTLVLGNIEITAKGNLK